MLSLNNINKYYQNGLEQLHVLKELNLTITEGDFISILGKSGSGKSTLLKILGLIDNEFHGEYLIDGQIVTKLSDKKLTALRSETVGFVFQDFQLLDDLNVYHNLEIALVLSGIIKKEEQRALIEDVLDSVGLADKIHVMPYQLSGGQKQRLSIARALVKQPKIIIADELTGSLDEVTAAEIIELLIKLNEQGNTLIIVTHDVDLAKIAKRQFFLKDGVLNEL
ncbi:MAG: ABC transporter ATP-binding protein [Mycoplasmatales bacterium]